MAQYKPLFYRGAPASIPQVVAHLQKAMSEEDPDYTPLRQRMPPASIPDIVAHIQKYLTENVFVTMEDLGEDIAQYIEDHPEIVGVLTVNGSSGNVVLDASDIPLETGEDPTIAGAISYLSSQLALLVADAVMSVNGVTPDDSHDVTLTGADIAQDANTTKKLSETFGPATASTAGTKGLVPAPAAGDENKVLSGKGTWVVNQSAGGVSSVCNVEPNAQGNVPLKGSDIPLQNMSVQTVAQAIAAVGTTFTGATSQAAGAKGQVPAPSAGDENKVLSGAGTWVTPSTGSVQSVCSVSPDAQGNVPLTGSAVPTSTTDNTSIDTSLSNLNDQIVNLQNGIAYVENGDTATQKALYNYGEYIIWKGVLYYVSDINGIAQGATLAGKVAQPPTGALNRVFDHYSSDETIVGTWIDGKPIYRKVLSGTLPSNAGAYTIGNIGANRILVSARFIIKVGNAWSAEGPIYSGTNYTPYNAGYVNHTIGDVNYKSYVSAYFGSPITAIIEYVK